MLNKEQIYNGHIIKQIEVPEIVKMNEDMFFNRHISDKEKKDNNRNKEREEKK